MAVDHFDTFSHPQQSQAPAFACAQCAFVGEAFAVVFYFQAHQFVELLQLHFGAAGASVAGDIIQRFLGDAVEHGSLVPAQLFNRMPVRSVKLFMKV